MAQQFRRVTSIGVSLLSVDGFDAVRSARVAMKVVTHSLASPVILTTVKLERRSVFVLLVSPVAEMDFAHLFRLFMLNVRRVLFEPWSFFESNDAFFHAYR